MVNRIWQHHFGAGIVATPNDFGRMGTRPSTSRTARLAGQRFVEGGFRMKPMHRMILLSNTYQQASPRDSSATVGEGSAEPAALALSAPPSGRRGTARRDARGERPAESAKRAGRA